MFGYVRPLKDALDEASQAHYQAAYCGLCQKIGREYGFAAQQFLNYDFAFLAMVLAAPGEEPCFTCLRCPGRPYKKREAWVDDPGLSQAAAQSVILTYWKLKDGIADSGLPKSLALRGGKLVLHGAYQKARTHAPAFDETVRENLAELRALEEENCPSPDRPADTFARILQASAGEEPRPGRAALSQLLYHVGRWVYLIDAWDDLEEDKKSGNYNPILARYGGDLEAGKNTIAETMYASLGFAQEAAAWLDFGLWQPVIDNILTLGLPAMEEAVLSGAWKNRRKRNQEIK